MSDAEHEAEEHDAEAEKLYAEANTDFGEAASFESSGDHEMAEDRFNQATEEKASGDYQHGLAEHLREGENPA